MMIGMDMDGVLTDFPKGFSRVLQRIEATAPLVESYDEITDWEWRNWYWPEKKDRDHVDWLLERGWQKVFSSETFWRNLPDLDVKANTLANRNHRKAPIIFISRRDGTNPWRQTCNWLMDRGFYEPLVIRVGKGEEKVDLCKRYGITALVEDNPKQALLAAEGGIHVLMPHYRYNEDAAHERIEIWNTPARALERALEIGVTDAERSERPSEVPV